MVFGVYLTGEMGWGGCMGKGGRDSSPDNQRVGTGGIDFTVSDKRIFTISKNILAHQVNIGYTISMRILTYKEFERELLTNKRKPSFKAKSLSFIDQYYYYLITTKDKK
jgi:hypothetical protein